jgi:gliding motility-associated-like protein
MFLLLSDTVFTGCDTTLYEEFIHYSIFTVQPDCDDDNCRTVDTYDELSCKCVHEEFIFNSCLEFYFPNTFTPNMDGKNDFYLPVVYNSHLIDYYQLWIYNRWGEVVFSTTDIYDGWDSSNHPIGLYTWRVNAFDTNGDEQKRVGQVSLLR